MLQSNLHYSAEFPTSQKNSIVFSSLSFLFLVSLCCIDYISYLLSFASGGKKRGPKLILLCCQIFPRHLLYVIGKKSDFFNPALHHCICSLKLNFSVS